MEEIAQVWARALFDVAKQDNLLDETREQLGGYFLIDARDRDEAIRIAMRIPAASWGTVEVRPVVEMPGLPTL